MRNLLSGVLGALGRAPAAEPLAVIHIPLRPDRVGDRRRYVWETEVRETSERGTTVRSTWEDFQLEIAEVRPDGLKIARRRLASRLDGASPDHVAFSRSWIGVRVLFDTYRGGVPRTILNWREAGAKLLDNFRRALPDATEAHEDTRAFLAETPPEVAATEVLGDELFTLASMRPAGPTFPLGRRDLPTQTVRGRNGGRVKLLSATDATLLGEDKVRVERTSWTADGCQKIRTTVVLAVDDGWALDFASEHTETYPHHGYAFIRTVKGERVEAVDSAG